MTSVGIKIVGLNELEVYFQNEVKFKIMLQVTFSEKTLSI
jgi:hypothetical protein